MAITSWTDRNMDFNNVQGIYAPIGLEAITNALNERSENTNNTLISYVEGDLMSVTLKNDIRAKILASIPVWLNQENATAGEFIGFDSSNKPPRWTTASMLTSLGDVAFYDDNLISARMMEQWYQIINRLVWRDDTGGNFTVKESRSGQGATETTIAAARTSMEDAFNAASWSGPVGFSVRAVMQSQLYDFGTPEFRFRGLKARKKPRFSNFLTTLPITIDAYIDPSAPAGGTFDDNGDDVLEGFFHRYDTELNITDGELTNYSPFTDNPPVFLVGDVDEGWINDGGTLLVAKYDEPNGFNFTF